MQGIPVRSAASNLTGTIPIKRLFRYHDTLLARLQLCFSVLATALLLLGLTYWYLGEVPVRYSELALIAGLLTFITYELMGVFRQARGRVAGLPAEASMRRTSAGPGLPGTIPASIVPRVRK